MTDTKKQYWEMIASPGHVLYERVRVYTQHAVDKTILVWGVAGVALVVVGSVIGLKGRPALHAGLHWVQAKVVDWYNEPAPMLHQIRPVIPPVQADALADVGEASKWLLAANKPDQAPAWDAMGCKDLKITASWPAEPGVTACRLSKDKDRLWVWGVVGRPTPYFGKQPVPVMAVYRLGQWTADGKKTWGVRSVEAAMLRPIDGIASVRDQDIPRALGADFPELLISKKGE